MKIFSSSKEASPALKKTVIVMGNFDGVHLAHQALIHLGLKWAKKLKSPLGVYTFLPHPTKILSPNSAPLLISTLEQKKEWLSAAGVEILVSEPFTPDLAKLSPETFFENILCDHLHSLAVIVGYDFTFGIKRSGNVQTLSRLCGSKKIIFENLSPFFIGETLVSSSQIRRWITEGRVEEAAQLLGRPVELRGEIVKGDGLGNQLGFPTANLNVENELIPGHGVYFSETHIKNKKYSSITNIGQRPSVGGQDLRVETHLLQLSEDLYGKKIQLKLIKKIRDEMRFSTVEELKHQISQDVQKAKLFHANRVKENNI